MKTLGSWGSENGPTFNVEFKDLDEQLRFLRKMISGPQVTLRDNLGLPHTIGDFRTHPKIRELALSIIKREAAPRDKKQQALAIGQWVQDNIYYVHEMPERFQTPIETLRLAAGDCDDSAQLVGSLLECVGIPSQLVCMQIQGVWKHIFCAAVMQNGALLPLDTTLKDYPVNSAVNPTMLMTKRGNIVRIKLA